MKSIYTILNDRVYKINQNTAVPTVLTFRAPGISSTVREDAYNKEANFNVYINTLEKPGTKSNKELYEKMIDLMRDRCITEVPIIQNNFKIYVDYVIMEDGREIDHQSVMKPIDPLDKIYPLGCATNNETVYRRVKTFNPKLEFVTRNSLPYGITGNPKHPYTFKITNIAIFEDFTDRPEIHNSQYDVSFNPNTSTIKAALGDLVQIYSTENLGIDIQPMQLSYIPRHINLNIEFIFAGLIVAYTDQTVYDVIKDNLDKKYPSVPEPPVAPEGKDDPAHLIPEDESKESADGRYDPDKDGYFAWYSRTTETNPKGLLVVEDAIPDGSYDVTSMIKKSMVIKDIKDIEVGEYVIYNEALNTNL